MYIVVVEDERGALVGEHVLSGQPLQLGRTPDNDIVLPSGAVSRRHATIYLRNGAAYITDEGSSNGVLVGDQRIREATQIDEGSQIRLGEYRVFLERAQRRAPQEGINTAIVRPDQAHGKLVVVAGNQAGREHLLFEPIIAVGRTDENDVTLPDVSVSRHHARLKRQDDGSYVLTDLNSSNGTLVHGRRLTGAARIWHGDRVQFGNIECMLVDPSGKGRSNRQLRQFAFYGLLVFGAAIIGALASLLLMD